MMSKQPKANAVREARKKREESGKQIRLFAPVSFACFASLADCPVFVSRVAGSERSTEVELQRFLERRIARLVTNGPREIDHDGADRGDPLQRNTDRGAKLRSVEVAVARINVADVGKQGK